MSRRAFVDFSVLVITAIGGWWAITNQQAIKDWWVLRSYEPPAAISQLAEDSSMSDSGERVFYASRPELNGREAFNTNCPFPERSLVLGCYANGRIYIFDIDSKQLQGVEEVTSAHEMLHAVYARLSSGERSEVDGLLTEAFNNLKDKRVLELIDTYKNEDPEQLNNELHSILGTEVMELSEGLENHYADYFDDRSTVVKLAASYEEVFTNINKKIDAISKRISDLKNQIANSEASLTSKKNALDAESDHLNNLKQSGQISQYNAGVPGYNAMVADFNALIAVYKSQVSKHNDLVDQHNDLAAQQNQLIDSIDSKFQPIN